MATRLVDVDLTVPLPDALRADGYDRVQVVLWEGPLLRGVARLPVGPGHSVSGDALARAVAMLEPAPPLPPADRLPSLSVVVPTRHRADRLAILLAALREQTVSDFELVVVDNSPGDPATRRVVESGWPDARYVVEPVAGIPFARNAGAAAASGEVVAFTDDDCHPVRGWLESIARGFAGPERPGCVTGPILPLELETPAQEAMEDRGGFNRGCRRARFSLDTPDGPVYPVQAWRFGAGASMAFARDCLTEVGGFDPALPQSEDIDMFYRVVRSGSVLAFEPGAAVRHRHLPAWEQLRRRLFHWGWGYLLFLDKVARTDSPPFAKRARQERRNWLRYQLRERALPALAGRADLPAALVLREIGGGLVGYHGYPLARARARRLRPGVAPLATAERALP